MPTNTYSPRKPWQSLTYGGKHAVARDIWGPATDYLCIDCEQPAAEWSTEDPDADNPWDYFQARCLPCHTAFDMHLKPRGETHVQTKLTDALRAEVRAKYASGLHEAKALAAEYGVSESLVRQVVAGVSPAKCGQALKRGGTCGLRVGHKEIHRRARAR